MPFHGLEKYLHSLRLNVIHYVSPMGRSFFLPYEHRLRSSLFFFFYGRGDFAVRVGLFNSGKNKL